ncbi:hypothetical protein GGX14DRAFT_542091 [Mycena pura]|uniref:Uncharacterized protein n=1 Tax=Mycena pura TaxID=153505 RepID=A0AAD6YFU0_9AGAR|nr:hypothetical protein GGX14DRAFT_542091 [Mycena pura]
MATIFELAAKADISFVACAAGLAKHTPHIQTLLCPSHLNPTHLNGEIRSCRGFVELEGGRVPIRQKLSANTEEESRSTHRVKRAMAAQGGGVGRHRAVLASKRARAGRCRAAAARGVENELTHAHGSVRGASQGSGGAGRRNRACARSTERARAAQGGVAGQRALRTSPHASTECARAVQKRWRGARQRREASQPRRAAASKTSARRALQGGGGAGHRNRACARSPERARAAA